LIKTGEPTYLVMRSPYQYGLSDRIEGLAGSVREVDFNEENLANGDRHFNLRAHPLQSDYVWGSIEFEEKYPGYKINDVLRGICSDYGIAADFDNLAPFTSKRRPDCAGKTVFIPGSAGIVKCWPASHWLELAERLEKQGHDVIVVGQTNNSPTVKQLAEQGLELVDTPTLADALDVLSSAALAIGVDTGLMHLAVTQGIPTVGLFRYNTMFVRPYPHFRWLSAPLCPQECLNREYGDVPNKTITFDLWKENALSYWLTWTCAADEQSQHCMSSITPDMVQETLSEIATRKSIT